MRVRIKQTMIKNELIERYLIAIRVPRREEIRIKQTMIKNELIERYLIAIRVPRREEIRIKETMIKNELIDREMSYSNQSTQKKEQREAGIWNRVPRRRKKVYRKRGDLDKSVNDRKTQGSRKRSEAKVNYFFMERVRTNKNEKMTFTGLKNSGARKNALAP